MKKIVKVSIASKLLFNLYVIGTSVAACITVATSYVDYDRESKVLKQDVIQLSDIASKGISTLLWNRDLESMKIQLNGILENPMAYGIEVFDDAGNSQFAGEAVGRPRPNYPFKHEVDIRYDDGAGAKPIGRMVFIMSKDKVVDGVMSRFFAILLLNAIKAVIVSTLMFLVLRRLITRPIQDLVTYFHSMDAPTDKNICIKMRDRKTSYDEISELLSYIQERERALSEHNQKAIATIDMQATKIEQTEEQIASERERAELNVRMAQLGELSAGIAHEINNPLTIIAGYSRRAITAIKKAPPNLDKVKEDLSKIELTTARIGKITNGLLAYSRDGQNDPFSLASATEIVSSSIELYAARLSQETIDLRVNCSWPAAQQIECRSSQLVQILVIMINNALDAIKKIETRWIEIAGSVQKDQLTLTVTDSGFGIPLDIERKIFDPFFTTKPIGEGTGLGLSVAFGIVKSHNGQISVNRESPNTQFVIRFPLAHSQIMTAA